MARRLIALSRQLSSFTRRLSDEEWKINYKFRFVEKPDQLICPARKSTKDIRDTGWLDNVQPAPGATCFWL